MIKSKLFFIIFFLLSVELESSEVDKINNFSFALERLKLQLITFAIQTSKKEKSFLYIKIFENL